MDAVAIAVRQMLKQVNALQAAAEQLPQVECPVREYFAPGVYCRECTIPEGVVAIGAVHRTEHLSILSKGHIRITTETEVIELHAPATILSKPGVKRACLAITEAVFTTIHPTDETDPAKLCALLTYSTHDQLMGNENNVQLLTGGRA